MRAYERGHLTRREVLAAAAAGAAASSGCIHGGESEQEDRGANLIATSLTEQPDDADAVESDHPTVQDIEGLPQLLDEIVDAGEPPQELGERTSRAEAEKLEEFEWGSYPADADRSIEGVLVVHRGVYIVVRYEVLEG